MSNKIFVVEFCHCADDRGRYDRLETVYHLHNDYENFRCKKVQGEYVCTGCQEKFGPDVIKNSPRRELSKNKSYWLELIPTGQHLPNEDQEKYWYHVHPQDDLAKRKEVTMDLTKIYATCPVCQKTLHMHTWKEKTDNRKAEVFSGIVMEELPVSLWVEIEIFRKQGVEIWLKDKQEKYFLLSANGQLLPAEKQGDILCCGEEIFLDNDQQHTLLFVVDDVLDQEMIDQHLAKEWQKESEITDDFQIHIPMLGDEPEIPKKPETYRSDRSTKELSSGELIGMQKKPEREDSQEVIVIVADDHTETHKIPKHFQVNLDEPTPLPEDILPLLNTEVNPSDDDWPPKVVVTIERKEISGSVEAPNSERANAEINENTMRADGEMLGNQLPDFTSDEDDWFASGEIHTDVENTEGTDVASEPTMALADAPTAAIPTVTEVAPAEPAMTEQSVTDVENTDVAEAAPEPVADDTLAKLEAAEAELENANEVITQLLGQNPVNEAIAIDTDVASEPTMALAEAPTAAIPTVTEDAPPEPAMTDETGMDVTEAAPATDHSLPETIHCEPAMTESANTGTADAPSPEPIPANGDCGSPFTKKPETATPPQPELKNVLTKIGLAMGMVGILVFVPMIFAWLINYFQSEDLKTELRAAEKRRMELSSQTNKLRVEADQIRFDLLESKRDLSQVRNDIPILQAEQQKLAERQSELDNRLSNALSWEADLQTYFVKEKNLFGQYLAQLEKKLRDEQKAWQRQERERSEQRYAELVKLFKGLGTQPLETPVAAPSKNLFGGKPEQETPKTSAEVQPFWQDFLTALIRENEKLAKKYRKHKKAPPTLVVDKTPVTPPPQNPTNITPPAVNKSVKDKVTAPVDKYPKPKNPQKLAEKSPKKPQKTETPPTFEAKDLVHVWTGPTYF